MNKSKYSSFQRKTPMASALAVAFAATCMTGIAVAQSDQDEEFSGLEEVIVTATKRAESLQEVGMAITAINTQELERLGAVSLLDFAIRVPNLAMAYEADGRFNSNSPSIRGIFGTGTTGFYIDDVQVTASLLPRVVDLERVEVLRGPQGTLYGARSMGGTIRMITNKAKINESENKVHAVLSSVKEGDQNWNFDGIFNIPVIEDKFAIRVTAYYGQNSGIFDRTYIPQWTDSGGNIRQSPGPAFDINKNVDDEKYYGGNLAATWIFTDNLSLDLKFMGQKVEADGLPFADVVPDSTLTPRFFDSEEPGTDEWYVASGTFNWTIDAGTFVSTTSYYERETSEWEEEASFLHFLFDEVIGIPIDPLESVLNVTYTFENFSHETRFTSNYDGALNFTTGVFYQNQKRTRYYPRAVQTGLAAAIDEFTDFPGLGQNCEFGFCLTDDDLIFTTNVLTKTEELAFFGELTWEINDIWAITAGGRWSNTTVDADSVSDGFANDGPSSFVEKQSESSVNPKLLIQAALSDDLNLYGSAAKGFRVGGINGNLPASLCGAELAELGIDPSNATSFDSDSLWSYELGFKSRMADNRVSLNAAVFFIDWSNVQQFNRLACGFSFTANAGAAESKGFEIELTAAPVQGLSITAAVGYTDAKITDDGGVSGVFVGDKVQGVPDWTGTLSAQYLWPAFDSWEGMVRGDANYYGDSFSANNESVAADARLRASWSQLNLRGGIINEKWDLLLFVDNITDERASLADSRSIAAERPGRQRLVVTRPRTFGIEARMRF